MPLRARSGSPSGGSSAASEVTPPLAAAAAPAAAAAATASHPGVHHGVRRHGRSARCYGGEVGDHPPRLRRATLGTLRRLVRVTHRAHEVEAILAASALVLVEGHLYPTSRSTDLTTPVLYRPSHSHGSPTMKAADTSARAQALRITSAVSCIFGNYFQILPGVKVP